MNKKVIAYSLLAHLNENNSLAGSYEDFFIPLVKRALSKMCSEGKYEGSDLQEINDTVKELYGLDMPNTVLFRICRLIEEEINKDGKQYLKFYSDYAFVIREYTFSDFEDFVQQKEKDLDLLEQLYSKFANSEKDNSGSLPPSIFEFIETNKLSLSKYIKKNGIREDSDTLTAARFIEFIKGTPDLYNQVESLYIGSIISTYLEYEPKNIPPKTELVLDTNFIVSLLDLNTVESTKTCQQLIELGKRLGYFFTVLDITIQETQQLIENRIHNFDTAFLSKLVDQEDIYNACHRRSLSKTDLERISANLENKLGEFGIKINYDTEKFKRIAKNSNEIDALKKYRNTAFAALHDVTCFEYVKAKRKKPIFDFNKSICWFVNNSSSRNGKFQPKGQLPLMIKAEDLLNMLWLTSPFVRKNLTVKELANIGISRMISNTLNDSLPNSAIIRELDENIRKYSKENISDEDVVRISKSIAQRKVNHLEKLNDLAKEDDKEFTKRLQEIANHQRESEAQSQNMIKTIVQELNRHADLLRNERIVYDEKKKHADETVSLNFQLSEQLRQSRKEIHKIKNDQVRAEREKIKATKIRKWRIKLWLCTAFYITILVTAGLLCQFTEWGKTAKDYSLNSLYIFWPFIAINGIVVALLTQAFQHRFLNRSNIEKFAEKIKYPPDLNYIDDNE